MSELINISVAETKAKLSEKLRGVENRNRRYCITSHGKPQAVLISYKEYIGLTKKTNTPKRVIDIKKWSNENKQREEVLDSVSERFDTNALSKKGQKGYKKNAVNEMEKTKRRSKKSIKE